MESNLVLKLERMLYSDREKENSSNLAVLEQKNNLRKWKEDSVSYGQRWIVEIVFSCLKRMFG